MMFQSSSIKAEKWNQETVAAWLKGVDSTVCQYHRNFLDNRVDGRRLLMLDHNDLLSFGVLKVGHQEIILDALELLLAVNNDINRCNLQSLALVVTCRISNLHRILESQCECVITSENERLEKQIIDAVYYLVQALKQLIDWLNSLPFTGIEGFTVLHQDIARSTLSLIKLFSKSSRVCPVLQSVTEHRSYILNKLADIDKRCDDLIKNETDPMILTPASLETITIRKRADEPLGLQLQSTQRGVTIKQIREKTACENVSRLEAGDQIVQVNGQAVVGWNLNNVVSALKEKPKDVTLTVRKGPRHYNLPSTQRRPSPKANLTLGENLKQSTFPKRASKHGSDDGSFEGKVKSSSIGEPPVTIHTTSDLPSPSTFDDVFSPSSADTDTMVGLTPPVLYDDSQERRSTMNGDLIKPSTRPVILVNDRTMSTDLPTIASSSTAVPGTKKEILSNFSVVKSTPELRTPDAERDVVAMMSNPPSTSNH